MKYKVRLLDAAEHGKTRPLYEKVFREDSSEFVDYYYRYKVRENRIYVAEGENGEILSMLHLNPYLMRHGAQEMYGEYIVAVATDERYRGQGMMRSLLKTALEDMRRVGEPFAFLMPAAEAIYRPFGFRFIYSQKQGRMRTGDFEGMSHLPCRAAEKRDLPLLAEFANRYLGRRYRTFAFHTEEYFEALLKEQQSQHGEVVLMLEQEKIRGYFFTAFESEAEVREPVADKDCEALLLPTIAAYLDTYEQIRVYGCCGGNMEGIIRKPVIMARMTNPEWFVSGLTAEEPVKFCFELTDELLPENAGVYQCCIDSVGGRLYKDMEAKADFEISAGDFTELAFGALNAGDTGMPESLVRAWSKVRTFDPVFLNEVV